MKYRALVRVTIEKTVTVEADHPNEALRKAEELFNPRMDDDFDSEDVSVRNVTPVESEPPNDDLTSQHAARIDRGPTKDDYMESGIDFQDPQWDLPESDYQGA